MKQFISGLIISFVLLFIIGCDKSDDSTSAEPDPAKAQERVNQGNQIMVPRLALLINSGGRDTAALNMSAANALYREALTHDPNNTHAHFGVALTGVVTVFADPNFYSLLNSSNAPITPFTKNNLSNLFSSESDYFQQGNRLKLQVQKAMMDLVKPENFLLPNKKLFGTDTPHPPSYYQNLIETKLLPVLSDAIIHLQRVTQNPNFAFYITPAQLGGNISDSIRIDLTEIYLLLSIVQMINSEASFAVAYNVDYDATSQTTVSQAWQQSSSFLSLRTNGAQRMKDTRSNFIGCTNSIQSGILYLKNETSHPGIDPIRYRPEDEANLMQLYAGLDTLEKYLSGPISLYGDFDDNNSKEYLTVNFMNFFDNAISNLKMKLPTYTVSTQASSGKYYAVLTWQANSFSNWIFPDATFNGFLPGMTDASLKQTFGVTSSDWQQSVVVGN
ncbi:MAG: hypothetical protein HY960_15980 [Ignavibacteriae bacterium]|nr:hypothetical protein [Ignavibacteriota bacterium]